MYAYVPKNANSKMEFRHLSPSPLSGQYYSNVKEVQPLRNISIVPFIVADPPCLA